ncbi:unnamed protein product, partial [Rotaria sp. Silwood2]
MYYIVYFLFLIISLTCAQSSLTSNSLCAQHYPYDVQQQQCECEDIPGKGISLKCIGHSYVPHFLPNIQYHVIELESCSQDLYIGDKTFADLNINSLRLRHCNLVGLNEESFSKINHLEKFIIENSTINSLTTSSGNFQDIFFSDSFRTLKLLTLKKVHYHQSHKHDKKLNLELLFNQLKQLNRLELINIYIDNYHYHNLTFIGQNLTYLKLISTHQTSLLPIEYFKSLESLVLLHLPQIFHTQPLISSIKKLKHLKYIDFGHNRLTHINGLQSNTIDQIDLASNLIEFIDEYTFEHLPKLRTLTLTGNPLQYIDKNAFCGIENFKHLYINIQKLNQVSPLDNCILLSHPNLIIGQDSQTKFQCDCQLMNIYQLQKKETKEINRLFKLSQACIVTNNTLLQSNYYQQLTNHLNSPIYIHELGNYLNCSLDDQCDRLCQERKIKTTLAPIPTEKINII